jgi:hypothetical protein
MSDYIKYGIGDSGVFTVEYKAKCSKCSFIFNYKYEENLTQKKE